MLSGLEHLKPAQAVFIDGRLGNGILQGPFPAWISCTKGYEGQGRLRSEGGTGNLSGEAGKTNRNWRFGGSHIPQVEPMDWINRFSAKIVGDELVLRVAMNTKPEGSTLGKTPVVASTHGNTETDCIVDGKKATVGVNAYIPVK